MRGGEIWRANWLGMSGEMRGKRTGNEECPSPIHFYIIFAFAFSFFILPHPFIFPSSILHPRPSFVICSFWAPASILRPFPRFFIPLPPNLAFCFSLYPIFFIIHPVPSLFFHIFPTFLPLFLIPPTFLLQFWSLSFSNSASSSNLDRSKASSRCFR